jgi:hypothetical protein
MPGHRNRWDCLVLASHPRFRGLQPSLVVVDLWMSQWNPPRHRLDPAGWDEGVDHGALDADVGADANNRRSPTSRKTIAVSPGPVLVKRR